MKTTVVHHSADFDGIFCREIARKFLPGAELVGWDFSDAPLAVPEGQIYVMDLPLDAPFGGKSGQFNMGIVVAVQEGRLVWIDHHKSAIETHAPETPGYRIDGVAACRLAWRWFSGWARYKEQGGTDVDWFSGKYPFPTKQDFIDRTVEEPLAVRLAGEYDIWDRRDPRAEVFQFGLRSEPLTEGDWTLLLGENSEGRTNVLLENGKMLQAYQQRNDAGVMGRSFVIEWEGLKFLVLNTARCNSLTFAAKDVPETGHDALMGFYFNGTKWVFSLYHARHRTELDLSALAVKYGGGGHRGACGFQGDTLPFPA